MKISQTPAFKRDFKRLKKKNFDMNKLLSILKLIQAKEKETLYFRYKDHALKGNWKGYRELHIEPDCLLIYKVEEKVLTLVLSRTGSHNDLF